ncbi:MAG: hypothetical protein ABJO72_05020 [Hyphomicrobiales bacterium]
MENFHHQQLIKIIGEIDVAPENSSNFTKWITAHKHLELLEKNSQENEVILYASGPHTFVHSFAVPRSVLEEADIEDLHKWSCNPFNDRSRYVSGLAENSKTRVEHGVDSGGSKTLDAGLQLVFARTFDGWQGDDRMYIEILQEFSHLAGIHWRSELSAYCRIDNRGDVEPVVTVTIRKKDKQNIFLVTCNRETLDEFLAASGLALVWLFDFTLLKFRNFSGWGDAAEKRYEDNINLSYRQKLVGSQAGYTRGFQILEPLSGYEEAAKRIPDRWLGREEKAYAEFIAHDWRNDVVRKISTDPTATTNYFVADGNQLPFELSAVFFRPDVLLKYKMDKDKYRVGSRDLSCRDAWHLKTFDVNEAGQVHTYICYLRDLPIEEQLHWLSFNEEPKASISERAFTTDFKGEFTNEIDPLDKLRQLLNGWIELEVNWWKLIDEDGLDRISTPLTATRDEWAEAIMDLTKAIVEGFQTKHIRAQLNSLDIEYENNEGSIKLLERLWSHHDPVCAEGFGTLRLIQLIRSKTKGHAGSSEAIKIAKDALQKNGSFRKHFNAVCADLIDELSTITTIFGHDNR